MSKRKTKKQRKADRVATKKRVAREKWNNRKENLDVFAYFDFWCKELSMLDCFSPIPILWNDKESNSVKTIANSGLFQQQTGRGLRTQKKEKEMIDKNQIKKGDKVRVIGLMGFRYYYTTGDIVDVIGICNFPNIDVMQNGRNLVSIHISHLEPIEENKMMEEKEINRISEPTRSKLLKQSVKLGFVFDDVEQEWYEQIDLGNNLFVARNLVIDYIDRKAIAANYYSVTEEWFDIQPPKMRQMNLAEIDAYLHEKGRSLCKNLVNVIIFNYTVSSGNLESMYKDFGTLNPDNTFEPLPLTEDK